MKEKRVINLINNERQNARIASVKGCDIPSNDHCYDGDYAACHGQATDICVIKDYAPCYANAMDVCAVVEDVTVCISNQSDYT